MRINFFRAFSVLMITLGWIGQIKAQDLGNSPYSQIGIGDVVSPAFSHQAGMAGSGVSFTLPFQVNNINPALLSRIRRTILDVGVTGQLKFLEEEEQTQRDFGASLAHVALAFPISRKMSATIGLTPYSSVSYENSFTQDILNSDFTADVTYRGRGGLTSVYFANGIELLGGKNFRPDTLANRLALGLKINYIFGSVIDEVITQRNGGQNQVDYELAFYRRTGYSDFTFEPGLAYTRRIGKLSRLNLGAVYALGNKLNANRFVSVDRRFQDNTIESDTLTDGLDGKVSLSSRLTLGASWEKMDPRSGIPKWAISADLSIQNWDEFRDFDQVDALGNNVVFALGGMYIPEFTSVQRGFWKRMIYRAGFRYERTPLEFDGVAINDISFSAGFSMPFGRSSTTLNLSLIAGQRGTLSNDLIREQYLRASFGVTINDTWFIKRRFD